MFPSSQLLLATAMSIGFVHTLLGPDHYLPFAVIARALRWSTARTLWITFLCGLGHVGSSVLLGLIGAALGVAVERLTGIESVRGGLAAWALIAFGLVYMLYGIRLAVRGRQHTHVHSHDGATFHTHTHAHTSGHVHVHSIAETPEQGQRVNLTPWILFTLFVFGPCEPLIPLIMYPAFESSWALMLLVAAAFAVATVGTMLVVVLALSKGLSLLPLGRLERYSHALAGLAILASGLAIRFFGL